MLSTVLHAFFEGLTESHPEYHAYIRADKELRRHLSEKQIDKMVEDSFPASDPPSTY